MPEFPRTMVLEATQGRLAGGAAPDVFRGVSTDSRSVPRGALFVALKGEQFDGHDFVAGALEKGAGAALVSREVEAGPLIVVSDTLEALGALAAAHRSVMSARVVAITGSTGKTTTKEMRAGCSVEPDRATAIRLAIGEAGPDDLVLIAGKGHEDYQIFADRTIHFDDREVAAEVLREIEGAGDA